MLSHSASISVNPVGSTFQVNPTSSQLSPLPVLPLSFKELPLSPGWVSLHSFLVPVLQVFLYGDPPLPLGLRDTLLPELFLCQLVGLQSVQLPHG